MSAVADSDAPNVASPPARVLTVIGPLPCRAGEREPRCAHSPMRPRRCRYLEQRQRVPRRRACEQGGLSRDAPQKEAPCTRVCRVAQKRASRDTRSQFRIIWWPNLQIPSTRLQPTRSGVGASCTSLPEVACLRLLPLSVPRRGERRKVLIAGLMWDRQASRQCYPVLREGVLVENAAAAIGYRLTRVRRTRRNGIK